MGKLERLLIMSVVALSFTHPSAADTDLPPAGRSRFDQLVGAGPVAYPFSRLLNQLNAQLEAAPRSLPPLKITLIPLGRSLQRAAAAPNFFHFPRVVVAVDGASKPGFAPLQDRLFIGYQEKSAILEVISYNEAVGRFEFQVVRDYKQGATPNLHYARRALCLACHQNAAPIFARPLWDETPANPAIAAQLRATGRDFYGTKISGTDIAYFIDAATDRANLFSVWLQIWREGCGADEAGARCRREWFDVSLRYALSGVLPSGEVGFITHLQARWPRLWPRGLPIPNPDIPNRDPLTTHVNALATADQPSRLDTSLFATPLAHIPAAFEPLNPRPPLEYWKTAEPQRLIAGLASLFNPADVATLDQTLGRLPQPVPVQVTLPCRLLPKAARRMRFECTDAHNRFSGTWNASAGINVIGAVTTLKISDATGAPDIRLHGRVPRDSPRADFSLARGRQHARLSDGRRLTRARFDLAPAQSRVTLTLVDDFAAMRNVQPNVLGPLNALAASTSTFDAGQWLGHLLHTLAPAAPPLRHAASRLPTMQIEPVAPRTPGPSPLNPSPLSPSARLFDRHCGQCHNSPDAFPPNFLYGDAARLEQQLDHCAERIFYRLRMAQTPESQRSKTPMPPQAAISARGLDAHAWLQSPEFAALTEDASLRIRRQRAAPEAVLSGPYEHLRSCLPPVPHSP